MNIQLSNKYAQVIGGLATVWLGLVAAKQIPDNDVTHWIGVACAGMLQFLVYMGYNRTPNGNVIPTTVSKFVDKNVGRVIVEAGSADDPTTKPDDSSTD